MVVIREVKNKKTGEKLLAIDKRTISKVANPPRVKHLKYSRHLPSTCNNCPYRPQEQGGNGICTVYEKDAVCVIRKDIAKMFEKFSERNEIKLVDLMEAEFVSDYEAMRFYKEMENAGGKLDGEVTRRMNAITNLGKAITDIKSRTVSVEVTEKKTLTDDQRQEIARTIKFTKDVIED